MVKVKKNEKGLYNSIKAIADTGKPISIYTVFEHKRGRDETRIVSIHRPNTLVPEGWPSLSNIIQVEREFRDKNKDHHTFSYYISSLKNKSAELFYTGVRGHWFIENKLHWIKDTIFREDKIKTNSGSAPENYSIIRNISINIYRLFEVRSIKHATIYYAAHNHELCTALLRT